MAKVLLKEVGLIIEISVDSLEDRIGTILSIDRCQKEHREWDILQIGLIVGIPSTFQSFEIASLSVNDDDTETIYPPSDLLIYPDIGDDVPFTFYCTKRNAFLNTKYGDPNGLGLCK